MKQLIVALIEQIIVFKYFLYLEGLSGGVLSSVKDVLWDNSSWVYSDSGHNNNDITLWKSSLLYIINQIFQS